MPKLFIEFSGLCAFVLPRPGTTDPMHVLLLRGHDHASSGNGHHGGGHEEPDAAITHDAPRHHPYLVAELDQLRYPARYTNPSLIVAVDGGPSARQYGLWSLNNCEIEIEATGAARTSPTVVGLEQRAADLGAITRGSVVKPGCLQDVDPRPLGIAARMRLFGGTVRPLPASMEPMDPSGQPQPWSFLPPLDATPVEQALSDRTGYEIEIEEPFVIRLKRFNGTPADTITLDSNIAGAEYRLAVSCLPTAPDKAGCAASEPSLKGWFVAQHFGAFYGVLGGVPEPPAGHCLPLPAVETKFLPGQGAVGSFCVQAFAKQ